MKQYIQYTPAGEIIASVRSMEAPVCENQIALDIPISIMGRAVNTETLDIVDIETGYILNKETGHFEPDSTPTSEEAGFLSRIRAWWSGQ